MKGKNWSAIDLDNKGIICVAAAGNYGVNAYRIGSPACLDNVYLELNWRTGDVIARPINIAPAQLQVYASTYMIICTFNW